MIEVNKYDISVFFRDSSDPRFKLLSGVVTYQVMKNLNCLLKAGLMKYFRLCLNGLPIKLPFIKFMINLEIRLPGNLEQTVIDWHLMMKVYLGRQRKQEK